jgi:hypothetical protein
VSVADWDWESDVGCRMGKRRADSDSESDGPWLTRRMLWARALSGSAPRAA